MGGKAAEVASPCGDEVWAACAAEVAPLARRGLGRFAAEVGAACAADSLFVKFFINFSPLAGETSLNFKRRQPPKLLLLMIKAMLITPSIGDDIKAAMAGKHAAECHACAIRPHLILEGRIWPVCGNAQYAEVPGPWKSVCVLHHFSSKVFFILADNCQGDISRGSDE